MAEVSTAILTRSSCPPEVGCEVETQETASSPLGSCKGKKIRKFSENDADIRSGRLHSVDEGSGQSISKVPLTMIENNGEPNLKRRASFRIKKMSSSSFHDGTSRFPKLNDCAHFHYDNVELGQVALSMHEDPDHEEAVMLACQNGTCDLADHPFTIKVFSNGKVWLVKRCYEDFRVLDKQLHSCIYDRRFSQLVELPKGDAMIGNREGVRGMLSRYLGRFSQIAGDMINCGPVLNWMELDNHGNHVVASEESAINIPAVAAAHVTKRYAAQAPDEICLEVGDMISVIDMPPPVDTSWWRGKNGFDVGFFPRQCVELISDKIPPSVVNIMPRSPKPDFRGSRRQISIKEYRKVLNKHGKLITFLRSFILARPTRRGLKQRGILRERVFGCDLGEHLLNCDTDVPRVVQICTEFIEAKGVVDGIYRLSGVSSTVQWLRDEFDSEKVPDLTEYEKDIHCVSSVCKLYFRELPNPLLTYQLYKKFEEAAISDEDSRLLKMHDTVQQLPPPHYRTLHYIIKHLAKMAMYGGQTGMTTKNLAIVWAPNLLRSKDLAPATAAAFMEIKIQATVVEYLIRKVDVIFNDKLFPDVPGRLMGQEMQRPKSLILSTPTKLLSLEEARARTASQGAESEDKPKYIEVGGGPAALPKQYHTVIDLPIERKRASFSAKSKKSPGWKAFFSRSGSKDGKKKDADDNLNRIGRGSLRSVRSVESLTSSNSSYDGQRNGEGSASHKVVMRRNSVACVDSSNIKHASSHDSFFEVDAETIAAATKDFLASTAQLNKDRDSEDEIFIMENKDETKKDRSGVGHRKSSPLWIDQSLSSSESNITSPKTPLLTPRDISTETKPKMIGEENLLEISARALMANSLKLIPIVIDDDSENGSKAETESPQGSVRRRTKQLGVPSRRKIKSSPPMDLQLFGSSPPREIDIAEEEPSSKAWARKGSAGSPEGPKGTSVLEKITRAMKNKNKVRRESSLGTEPGKQSRGTQNLSGEDVDFKLDNTEGKIDTCTQDVDSQTTDEFVESDSVFGALSRPRSLSARAHSNRDSDLFEDLFPPETKFSLDTILSEYDHIMEKYSNRALTPEFDTSTEEGAAGKRTSFPRAPLEKEEYQPIPQFLETLNANFNQSSEQASLEQLAPSKQSKSLLPRTSPPISPMQMPQQNAASQPLVSPVANPTTVPLMADPLRNRHGQNANLQDSLTLNLDNLGRESDIIDFNIRTEEREESEKTSITDDTWHDARDNVLLESTQHAPTQKGEITASSETSEEFYQDADQGDNHLSLDLGHPAFGGHQGLQELRFPPEEDLDSTILGLKPGFGLSPEIRASQVTLASQYDNLDDSFDDRGVDCKSVTPPPCDEAGSPFEIIESPFCTISDENGVSERAGFGLVHDDVVENIIEL